MKKSFFVLVLLVLCWRMSAQDQHFSQYFASPLTLNPALTGLYEGRYRMSFIYRDQWRRTLDNPYSTFSGAADFRYYINPRKRAYKDAFGVGVLFYSDRITEINFSTNQFMLSAAYHKSLSKDNEHTLSLGLQFGIAQRNISYDQLTFEDEFNGSTAYNLGTTGERLPENNFAFGDYQIGLNYAFAPKKGMAVYAGAAIHHVGEPEQSFYFEATQDDDVQVTSTLHRKYSGYVNFRLPVGKNLQVSPRALVYSQGEHLSFVTGANLRVLMNADNGTAVHFGGWARPTKGIDGFMMDSAIGFFGLEMGGVLIGMSYDVGIHPVNTNYRHRGAFELSVAYLGQQEELDAVLCPKF